MGMPLIKTEAGQQAFKTRSVQLAGKLRSAFLVCDGRRSMEEVLLATQGLGVTQEDIEGLMQAGLLQAVSADPIAPPLAPAGLTSRTSQQRYQDAYPLAVALTGKLGLTGFRLNLSVEAATSFEDLAAVAPKIKDAVGPSAYAPLAQALFA